MSGRYRLQWMRGGAKEEECGNYTFMDLEAAKKAADYFVNSKWEHEYHLL